MSQWTYFRRYPVFTSYLGILALLILVMLGLLYSDYYAVSFMGSDDDLNTVTLLTKSNTEFQSRNINTDNTDNTMISVPKSPLHNDNNPSSDDDHNNKHHHHVAHDILDASSVNAVATQTHMVADKPWGEIYEPVRVWCLVPTLWPKKHTTMEAIATTWGRHCDQLIFVIDDEMAPTAPDIIYNATVLKLSFDHRQSTQDRNIWEKVWKMWYHIGKHHLSNSEWFLKIDDDTFFSAINFRGFVRHYNPDKQWYFGHTLMHAWTMNNVVFNSGTCYAISRGSLRAVYPIFETPAFLNDAQRRGRGKKYCVHRPGDQEDPTFSMCLRSMGINPSNSLDNQYRERWLPFRPGDHEKIEREGTWFWRLKHPKVGIKENCCSPNAVAFHNYKKDVMKSYTELDRKYNQKEGVDGKTFEIPNPPSLFLHGDIPFKVDEYMNIENPPAGQRIYKGPGKERFCHNCDKFDFK